MRARYQMARCFYSTKVSQETLNSRKKDHIHCVDLVKSRDWDGYLCGLLMPPSSREPFFAVRAFNVELASIKDGRNRSSMETDSSHFTEKSSIASHLRMEWWKAAISSMYNDTPSPLVDDPNLSSLLSHVTSSHRNNPVIRSLHRAVVEYNLTKRFLDRLIESREDDLDIAQFDSLQDLIQYSEESVSSSLYLSLECCGVRNEDADMVASHIGIGIGIMVAIRSIGHRFVLTKDVAIPKDMCEKYSISTKYLENLVATYSSDHNKTFNEDEPLARVVQELSHAAMNHLLYARNKQYLVPTEARPCLLPAVSCIHYLSSLEQMNFNVFHPHLLLTDSFHGRMHRLKVMLKLLRSRYTGVI